jgi:hypothetical protein
VTLKSLTFEEAVATLQSWLGEPVRLSVETGQGDRPLSLAHLRGVLSAGESIAEDESWAERLFPFKLGEVGGFELDSEWFHYASLDDRGLLVIGMGAPEDDASQAPEMYITRLSP